MEIILSEMVRVIEDKPPEILKIKRSTAIPCNLVDNPFDQASFDGNLQLQQHHLHHSNFTYSSSGVNFPFLLASNSLNIFLSTYSS